jgi:hypothetical protein
MTHIPEAKLGDPAFLRGTFGNAIEPTLAPREQKFLKLIAVAVPVQ